jgi:hypothetical protein
MPQRVLTSRWGCVHAWIFDLISIVFLQQRKKMQRQLPETIKIIIMQTSLVFKVQDAANLEQNKNKIDEQEEHDSDHTVRQLVQTSSNPSSCWKGMRFRQAHYYLWMKRKEELTFVKNAGWHCSTPRTRMQLAKT